MQLNAAQRELTLKIVYYGPGLSGKTTNLQAIHARLDPGVRGRLMTLDTADDRTLFFDMMPVFFQSASGLKVKLKLFTVPGQVMHESTRRIVLQGADAVAFIADSQRSQAKANNTYWNDLLRNLEKNGSRPAEVPMVIQFNKRDLPDTRTDEEIEGLRAKGKEPIYSAVAIQGIGVLETLHGLLKLNWDRMEQRLDFGSKFGVTEEEFMRSIFRNLDLDKSNLKAAFG
jgi:mutual gliding-motility protein MglA